MFVAMLSCYQTKDIIIEYGQADPIWWSSLPFCIILLKLLASPVNS